MLSNDRSRLTKYRGGPRTGYRAGAWNIYFLGQLAENLRRDLGGKADTRFRCYPHGAAPDTILNLGRTRGAAYLEVNADGALRLKLKFASVRPGSRDAVLAVLERAKAAVSETFSPESFRFSTSGSIGQTKTIALFNIGLVNEHGHLCYAEDCATTVSRMRAVLEQFDQLPLITAE